MQRLRDYFSKLSTLSASELLLSAERPPLYRTSQGLLPLPGAAELHAEELEYLLEAVFSADQLRELREQQHVSSVKQFDSGERVRAYCHAAKHGLTLKLVLLGLQAQTRFEPSLSKLLAPVMAKTSGLVVVLGPAGSGKSALISRMLLQLAAERQAYVVTAEEPVQYSAALGGAVIVQRVVGKHCSSHAQAIESALAARADVVACSDLAAPRAFERMLEVASSGALAIGELRAPCRQSGQGAIEQLLWTASAGERPLLARELADSLLAVCSVDLLPAKLGGRVLALELLTATPKLRALLREQHLDRISSLFEGEPGMQSMDSALLELAVAGLVEGHEAYQRAMDKTLFGAWS